MRFLSNGISFNERQTERSAAGYEGVRAPAAEACMHTLRDAIMATTDCGTGCWGCEKGILMQLAQAAGNAPL